MSMIIIKLSPCIDFLIDGGRVHSSLSQKNNYEFVSKGHSIQCFNSNMGFMTIRIVQTQSPEYEKTKDNYQHMEWLELSKLNSREQVQEMQPAKLTSDCETEKVGISCSSNKMFHFSCKSHALRWRKKRKSRLSVTVKRMKLPGYSSLEKQCSLNRRKSCHHRINNSSDHIRLLVSNGGIMKDEVIQEGTQTSNKHVTQQQYQQGDIHGGDSLKEVVTTLCSNFHYTFAAMKKRNYHSAKYRQYRATIKNKTIGKKRKRE